MKPMRNQFFHYETSIFSVLLIVLLTQCVHGNDSSPPTDCLDYNLYALYLRPLDENKESLEIVCNNTNLGRDEAQWGGFHVTLSSFAPSHKSGGPGSHKSSIQEALQDAFKAAEEAAVPGNTHWKLSRNADLHFSQTKKYIEMPKDSDTLKDITKAISGKLTNARTVNSPLHVSISEISDPELVNCAMQKLKRAPFWELAIAECAKPSEKVRTSSLNNQTILEWPPRPAPQPVPKDPPKTCEEWPLYSLYLLPLDNSKNVLVIGDGVSSSQSKWKGIHVDLSSFAPLAKSGGPGEHEQSLITTINEAYSAAKSAAVKGNTHWKLSSKSKLLFDEENERLELSPGSTNNSKTLRNITNAIVRKVTNARSFDSLHLTIGTKDKSIASLAAAKILSAPYWALAIAKCAKGNATKRVTSLNNITVLEWPARPR
jgi:hypothetical protein